MKSAKGLFEITLMLFFSSQKLGITKIHFANTWVHSCDLHGLKTSFVSVIDPVPSPAAFDGLQVLNLRIFHSPLQNFCLCVFVLQLDKRSAALLVSAFSARCSLFLCNVFQIPEPCVILAGDISSSRGCKTRLNLALCFRTERKDENKKRAFHLLLKEIRNSLIIFMSHS